jgi:hypothetical protein
MILNTWQVSMNDEIVLMKQLEELKEQHRQLDSEIDDINKDGWGDELKIARLKKQKLRLRDEIFALECQLYPDMPA